MSAVIASMASVATRMRVRLAAKAAFSAAREKVTTALRWFSLAAEDGARHFDAVVHDGRASNLPGVLGSTPARRGAAGRAGSTTPTIPTRR